MGLHDASLRRVDITANQTLEIPLHRRLVYSLSREIFSALLTLVPRRLNWPLPCHHGAVATSVGVLRRML